MQNQETIIQTAELQMADTIHKFHTIELRPLNGPDVEEFPDKIVRKNPNGGHMNFWNKPTIAAAVKTRGSGNFYQFHKNGAVVARYGGNTQSNYWSSPMAANADLGYSYFS